MKTLQLGNVGSDVRALQIAVNARAKSRGIAQIQVDGEVGPFTLRAVRKVAYAMGAAQATLDYRLTGKQEIPVGVQRMIRWPTSRLPAQLVRARQRTRVNKVDSLRERAWFQARKLIGVMERGGNNVGAEVEAIIRSGGGRRGDPWCGWFCAHVYKLAGSKIVDWRWGAVRLYVPLSGVKVTTAPLRGNLVRFTFDHIGMFVCWCDSDGREVGRGVATHIKTIEGNTGRSGAVSDSTTGGDGVYEKVRSLALVRDYLHISR